MAKNELAVNEIFFSIQGESSQAGRPCVFVRLMGCPLRCRYCDTEYAFFQGQKMSFEQIVEKIAEYPCRLVELTGGEPLAQPNAYEFLELLCKKGFEVMLETSGAMSLERVPGGVKIIMDVKTPASGELKRMNWDNMAFLKPNVDEVKFVVCSQDDFDFAQSVCEQYRLLDRHVVLMSPSWGQVELKDLAQLVLESGRAFRLQTQMHKVIWGPEVAGV